MRRAPSYLKGLAETRARLDGDIERYERVMAEVGVQLEKAQMEKDACDMLIKKFDGRLDPSLIAPVRGQNGRYGTRGKLKEAILHYVRAAEMTFLYIHRTAVIKDKSSSKILAKKSGFGPRESWFQRAVRQPGFHYPPDLAYCGSELDIYLQTFTKNPPVDVPACSKGDPNCLSEAMRSSITQAVRQGTRSWGGNGTPHP